MKHYNSLTELKNFMRDRREQVIINSSTDIQNYLCIKQSSLNFYVALTTVFSFGGESIERVQSVDNEIFNCYEHARRHALSMIRKHGSFENTTFKGDSMN